MVRALSLRAVEARLIVALAMCGAVPATAQQVNIETAGQGDIVTVRASAEMQVDLSTVWNAISDYDHLAEFIPNMRSSRVVQRNGDHVLVEQAGEFGFLFYKQPVEVTLAVVESPPQRIVAHAVAGDLREMEGHYELERLSPHTIRLSYFGRLVPEFEVPHFIGRMVVRSVLANQFTAMVKEILRRDALAKDTSQPD